MLVLAQIYFRAIIASKPFHGSLLARIRMCVVYLNCTPPRRQTNKTRYDIFLPDYVLACVRIRASLCKTRAYSRVRASQRSLHIYTYLRARMCQVKVCVHKQLRHARRRMPHFINECVNIYARKCTVNTLA